MSTRKTVLIEFTQAQINVLIEIAHFAQDMKMNKSAVARSINVTPKTVNDAMVKFMKGGKNIND